MKIANAMREHLQASTWSKSHATEKGLDPRFQYFLNVLELLSMINTAEHREMSELAAVQTAELITAEHYPLWHAWGGTTTRAVRS